MSLDIEDKIIIINTIPYDKEKLLHHCKFFSTIYDTQNTSNIILESNKPFITIQNFQLLQKWLDIPKIFIKTWKPSYLYNSILQARHLIIDHKRSLLEIELIEELSDKDLLDLAYFLDYIHCTDFLDICLMVCAAKVDFNKNKILNKNLAKIIVEYLVKPEYHLDPFFNKEMDYFYNYCSDFPSNPRSGEILKNYSHNHYDYWTKISKNPSCIEILKNNIDKVNWSMLCQNPNPEAIDIIEENLDKLNTFCWRYLSGNPNAINILEKHLDKVDFQKISGNYNAIDILRKNLDKVDWYMLCMNRHPDVVSILEENIDNIDWYSISKNHVCIDIILKNLDKCDMKELAFNCHPEIIKIFEKDVENLSWFEWQNLIYNENATDLLENNTHHIYWPIFYKHNNSHKFLEIIEKNVHDIDWAALSCNPSALPILKKNKEKILYYKIGANPSIFLINQEKFDKDCEELIKTIM